MFRTITQVCLVLLLGSLCANEGSVIGLWEGKYVCAQGVTRVNLKILEATPVSAKAIFRFSADSSNPNVPTGCFSMNGRYDPKSGSLKLEGNRWIRRPRGYFTVDFVGIVDPFGASFSGAVIGSGCRDFQLRKTNFSSTLRDDECGVVPDSVERSQLAVDIDKILQSTGAIDLEIPFEFGKATLEPAAKGQLDELGRTLAKIDDSTQRIGIYGHTDIVGTSEDNLVLSKYRAQAVAKYLVETFKISPSLIQTDGFGATKLKNLSDGTARENRRVEIRLLSVIPK